MFKYAVPSELVRELMQLGVCETEEEAREKVASGAAPGLIKEAMAKTVEEDREVIGAFSAPTEEE